MKLTLIGPHRYFSVQPPMTRRHWLGSNLICCQGGMPSERANSTNTPWRNAPGTDDIRHHSPGPGVATRIPCLGRGDSAAPVEAYLRRRNCLRHGTSISRDQRRCKSVTHAVNCGATGATHLFMG